MNICRLTLITLSLVLIAACGGGGGGGTAAAPTPTSPIDEDEIVNPLAGLANVNVMAENSTTIEAVETITAAMNAKMSVSPAYRQGSLDDIDSTCGPTTCFIPINELSMNATLPFNIGNPQPGLFPIDEASQHVTVTASTVTEGIRLDNGVTLARGNLTATFAGNPLEFRTFAGWIDGSVFFGTTHMLVGGGGGGSLGPQFISHAVGVPGNNNIPAALGTETSATWEGSAVGIRKADGTFLHGDARVVMPDFANSVIDVHLEGLRDISARTLDSNTFRWEDVDFNNSTGSFRSTTRSFFVEVRFYGEEQETVGGWFNHEEITGAFGGTRQPVP